MKNNIKKFREELGWSQERLAHEAGTSGPQINRLEKSQRRLTQEWMMKIADALGCHPSDLLPAHGEAEKPDPPRRAFLREPGAGAEIVPVRGHPGKARDAVVIDHAEPMGQVPAHPAQFGARQAFAFYARGDSMAPRYRPGELVYVVPDRPPAEGQDCLVELVSGESYLRQFLRQTEDRIICRQLNPEKEWRRDVGEVAALHSVAGRG